MNTIFLNSENSKTSYLYRLVLNFADKLNLWRNDRYIAFSNFIIYHTRKKIKNHIKTINLTYQPQHKVKQLNYLMDQILNQIFKIILRILSKHMKNLLIIFDYKYILTKLKKELNLKLNQDIILNF